MKTWLACLVVALIAGGPAVAKDDHDQDRARRAVQDGRMLPLRDIVTRAEAAFGGQVIEAEFEEEGGAPAYEIKIVTEGGRVLKLRYDARTGELMAPAGRR